MSDEKETHKLANQVVESFTACRHFTISKMTTGATIIFANKINYSSLPPIHAAALKTLEQTIICHHLMGVNISDDGYVKGVDLVMQALNQGAAETWGYENADE